MAVIEHRNLIGVLCGLVPGRMGAFPLPQRSAGAADVNQPRTPPCTLSALHRLLWVWEVGFLSWERLWGAGWEKKQWHILMAPPGCREWGGLRCLKGTPGPSLPWESSGSLAAPRGAKSQLPCGCPEGTAQAQLHLWKGSRDKDRTWIWVLGVLFGLLPGICTNRVTAQCSTNAASREELFPRLWLSQTLPSCCQWVFLSCYWYHCSESVALLNIDLKWRLAPVTTHP